MLAHELQHEHRGPGLPGVTGSGARERPTADARHELTRLTVGVGNLLAWSGSAVPDHYRPVGNGRSGVKDSPACGAVVYAPAIAANCRVLHGAAGVRHPVSVTAQLVSYSSFMAERQRELTATMSG